MTDLKDHDYVSIDSVLQLLGKKGERLTEPPTPLGSDKKVAKPSFKYEGLLDHSTIAKMVRSMAGNNSRNFRKRQTRSKRRGAPNKVSVPRPLQVVPVLSIAMRYYCNADFTGTISANFLCAAAGVCYTGATTGVGIFPSIRIREIRIWPTVGATSATVKCSISWVATVTNLSSDKETDRTLPLGQTMGQVISLAPPRDSLISGVYVENDFGNLVQLVAPLGSLIEVDASWLAVGNNMTTFSYSGLGGGTAGTLLYPPLDGMASNKLKPTRLPITT